MINLIKSIVFSKPGMVSIVFMVLLIPMALVEDKIDERAGYHQQVVNEIGESWTRGQTLIGPLIVIEYQTVKYSEVWNKESKKYETKTTYYHKSELLPMRSLKSDIHVDTEKRYRGIHEVPVYSADVKLTGEFDSSSFLKLQKTSNFHKIRNIYSWIFVSDQRGFIDMPQFKIGSVVKDFIAGGYEHLDSKGIKAPLDSKTLTSKDPIPFEVILRIKGSQHLSIVPVARSNDISVSSDWEHPKFVGRYLPNNREIGEEGFQARWQVTDLATNLGIDLEHCVKESCGDLVSNSFGVTLIDPVDIYQKSERAVKYALLFIGLVFTAFFVLEITRRLNVHPLQYLMMGAALSVFYLLLIALSEHIDFNKAYLAATLMCSALLGYYARYILESWLGGLVCGSAIAGLFGMLFVILQAEDIALLLGSLFTFLMLTIVMVVTRDRSRIEGIEWGSLSRI